MIKFIIGCIIGGVLGCLTMAIIAVGKTGDNVVIMRGRWMPASKPPVVTGEYNVMIRGDIKPTTLFYNVMDESWFEFGGSEFEVTHWMPLPEPPTDMRKVENDD